MTKHGVVNTGCISGTENCTDIYSVLVYNAGGSATVDCDNGTIVSFGTTKTLDTTIDGDENTEVYKVTLNSTATTNIDSLAIVASPELIYDEITYHPLEDFYNEAGKVARAFALTKRSRFALSKECFSNSGDITVGNYVVVDGAKLKAQASTGGSSATTIGVVEKILTYTYETFYVVRVQ